MADIWKPEAFNIAVVYGDVWKIEPRAGYTYRGLGIYQTVAPSPKGRRPAKWSLTHLNTGHCIAELAGSVAAVFPIATEIAEAGDWDFLSLEGYKDRFPDAGKVVMKIIARHGKLVSRSKSTGASNREAAMQIASNR